LLSAPTLFQGFIPVPPHNRNILNSDPRGQGGQAVLGQYFQAITVLFLQYSEHQDPYLTLFSTFFFSLSNATPAETFLDSELFPHILLMADFIIT